MKKRLALLMALCVAWLGCAGFAEAANENNSAFWEEIGGRFGQMWVDAVRLAGDAAVAADEAVEAVSEGFRQATRGEPASGEGSWWSDIGAAAGETWNGVSEAAGETWKGVSEAAGEAWDELAPAAEEAWSSFGQFVDEKIDGISERSAETWAGVKESGGDAWNSLGDAASGLFSLVTDAFGGGSDDSAARTIFLMGSAVKADGAGEIEEGDPHYGWMLGIFCVQGFSDMYFGADGDPVFRAANGPVTLRFALEQDIDRLNGSDFMAVYAGPDHYGRGALFLRRTDAEGVAGPTEVRSDFLEDMQIGGEGTVIAELKPGAYEAALDYQIGVTGDDEQTSLSAYRILIRFTVE